MRNWRNNYNRANPHNNRGEADVSMSTLRHSPDLLTVKKKEMRREYNKKKNNKYKKGQVVQDIENHFVLVTGAGKNGAGYDTFSGVVISLSDEIKETGSLFPVGTYSTTWNSEHYNPIDLNIDYVVSRAVIMQKELEMSKQDNVQALQLPR